MDRGGMVVHSNKERDGREIGTSGSSSALTAAVQQANLTSQRAPSALAVSEQGGAVKAFQGDCDID